MMDGHWIFQPICFHLPNLLILHLQFEIMGRFHPQQSMITPLQEIGISIFQSKGLPCPQQLVQLHI